MSKSLLFDLKVLEFKLKESLEQYEKERIEENLELLKSSIDELCSFIVKKEHSSSILLLRTVFFYCEERKSFSFFPDPRK